MATSHDRWVHFFYLQLSPHRSDVPSSAFQNFSMKSIAEELHKKNAQATVLKKFRMEREILRIVDDYLDEKNDIYHMQVRHTNKDGSDPAFADEEENKQRIAEKEEKEGNSTSAHIAVSLKSLGNHLSFPAAIEKNSGITLKKHHLESLLNEQFKNICCDKNYGYTDNEKRKFVKCWLNVAFEGMTNIQFDQDIENGLMESIELVSYEYKNQFDQAASLERVEHIVRLTPKEVNSCGSLGMKLLNVLRSKAKQDGFKDIRINFKRHTGKRQSINHPLTSDVGDFLLTKCEKYSTQVSKPNLCPEKLNPGLVEFITSELKKCGQ